MDCEPAVYRLTADSFTILLFFFISCRVRGIQIIMLIVDAVYLVFFNLSYMQRNVVKFKKSAQRRKLKVHESVQRSLKGDT